MIRSATKEDGQAIARLVLVILKDMELPILEEVSEEQMIDLLAEATAYPTYRYGYQRILVYEHAGEVVGIAVGYPAEDEKIIDEPLREVFKKHGLAEDVRLFIEEETLPNEWYLDTISVDERFRGMGIGSKLLDALPEVAKASGKQALGLNVDFDNPGARKLYASKGFKDVTTMTISGHLYNHMQKEV
ncbi:TPA: GNAT family N-acetyltransferase [Enterococcus faecalis]|nr:GNAT family N-acetyltransferase [Enterococcus faecalis]